jgi:transketolase
LAARINRVQQILTVHRWVMMKSELTKENLGLDPDKKFFVPDDVREEMSKAIEKGEKGRKWKAKLAEYEKVHPVDGGKFKKSVSRTLPE